MAHVTYMFMYDHPQWERYIFDPEYYKVCNMIFLQL